MRTVFDGYEPKTALDAARRKPYSIAKVNLILWQELDNGLRYTSLRRAEEQDATRSTLAFFF